VPACCSHLRVGHLGEGEVARGAQVGEPFGRAATVELPIPEPEHDDVRQPDLRGRDQELAPVEGCAGVEQLVDQKPQRRNGVRQLERELGTGDE
jgi:hypothetical protein